MGTRKIHRIIVGLEVLSQVPLLAKGCLAFIKRTTIWTFICVHANMIEEVVPLLEEHTAFAVVMVASHYLADVASVVSEEAVNGKLS